MNATVAEPKSRTPKSAQAAEASTDLIVAEAQSNPVALFTDEKRYSEFYERVKESVSSFVPDVSTDKGRKEIAGVAFKVTKSKTALDKAGLALTEEWRAKTAAVNAARKKMVTELDQLADEVRRPLTEWEAEEKARCERCERVIEKLKAATTVEFDESASDVEQRLAAIEEWRFNLEEFDGYVEQATAYQRQAVETLTAAVARLRKEEADRAELERLRQERAEREEREAAERAKREADEAEKRVEEERARAAQEAEERRKREIAEAEERARQEAEERARAEERREAEAKLAEERSQREAAEREAAEAHRKEQERLAWEAKEKRDREAREANERHRKAVIGEIADDLIAAGIPINFAHTASLAIGSGSIRHLTVNF